MKIASLKIAALLITIMLILIQSCTDNKPSDNNRQITNNDTTIPKLDIDTATESWMVSKKIPNFLFSNHIELKDGQATLAGKSFLLMDSSRVIGISAKHLLGTSGGFTSNPTPGTVSSIVKKWQMLGKNGKTLVVRSVKEGSYGEDLVYLDITGADTSGLKTLKKRQLPLSASSFISFFLLGNGQEENYGKIVLFPLKLAQDNGGTLVFENITGRPFYGYSGCPVVDDKGHVVGILQAGFELKGKKMLMVQAL